MRKLMLTLAAMAMCAVLAGCGTKAVYTPLPEAEKVNPAGKFAIGKVTDTSGFVFPSDEKDAFVLTDAMRDALKAELEQRNALSMPGDYVLNVNIDDYKPGSAFFRWLAPGAGKTELSIVCTVIDTSGKELATIPVNRFIAFGGAFTIGAWKYVFKEVAEALVQTLQKGK
jgi:predicted small lipoprotein YifL